jgi:C4-dicarboxylate transporter, DctM subunit
MIMERGGISERLVSFARVLLGRFRGGLPMGVVFASMLNSGVTGSMVADVSAMTAMTLNPLKRAGYEKPYSLALIGTASAFTILIPPCILMVVVAAVANVSVIALFAAGVLPALFLGAMMIAFIHLQARFYGFPADKAYSLKEVAAGLKDASLALGIPILIFGGIRLGVATVTEMAALAVVYALFVGGVIYKRLSWKQVYLALVETAVATAAISILMGFAMIISFLLATQGVPVAIANWMRAAEIPPWGVLLISALIFIFIGSLLEGAPAVLIFVPILLPLVRALEIDIVHWLTIVVLSSGIGLMLPPAGIALLMACSIGGVKMEKIVLPLVPFMAVLFVGLLILIAVPEITTVVPRAMGLPY